MKIYLNKDKRTFVQVDKSSYEWLIQWNWMLGSHGYAYRQESVDGVCVTKLMHRELLMAPKGFHVDHINRNKLDNRSTNLRVVTVKENIENRGIQKNNTSGYTGVKKQQSKTNPWRAVAKKYGKEYFVGVFKTAEEAYNARLVFIERMGG